MSLAEIGRIWTKRGKPTPLNEATMEELVSARERIARSPEDDIVAIGHALEDLDNEIAKRRCPVVP